MGDGRSRCGGGGLTACWPVEVRVGETDSEVALDAGDAHLQGGHVGTHPVELPVLAIKASSRVAVQKSEGTEDGHDDRNPGQDQFEVAGLHCVTSLLRAGRGPAGCVGGKQRRGYHGIPAAILILRVKGSKPPKRRCKVLFVNADRDYGEGRAQNHLRARDEQKITATYRGFADVDGFAKVVTIDEPAENDFNCNIRRYADNAPPPEPQDVRAHLQSGVPMAVIDAWLTTAEASADDKNAPDLAEQIAIKLLAGSELAARTDLAAEAARLDAETKAAEASDDEVEEPDGDALGPAEIKKLKSARTKSKKDLKALDASLLAVARRNLDAMPLADALLPAVHVLRGRIEKLVCPSVRRRGTAAPGGWRPICPRTPVQACRVDYCAESSGWAMGGPGAGAEVSRRVGRSRSGSGKPIPR